MFFRLSKGFKINAPFMEDNTPIHNVDLEEGVLGKANKNGTILVSDKITDPEERESVIEHEKVHIDQIKRGDLDYDDENVYISDIKKVVNWYNTLIEHDLLDLEEDN